jgi:hypothetical protein
MAAETRSPPRLARLCYAQTISASLNFSACRPPIEVLIKCTRHGNLWRVDQGKQTARSCIMLKLSAAAPAGERQAPRSHAGPRNDPRFAGLGRRPPIRPNRALSTPT